MTTAPHRAAESPRRIRRIHGSSDVFWMLVVVGTAAALVALLVGHLRLEFETYRLAADADRLTAEKARLEREYDELVVERQVRQDAVDLERVATERLGLQPVQPSQVFEVSP